MADTLRYREDEPVDHPAVTVDAFLDQSNASAVRIEPGDDARELVPHLERLALVEVNFPAFGDGRGYSSARPYGDGQGLCVMWILKALAGARGDGVRSPWSPASASVPARLLALNRCDAVRQGRPRANRDGFGEDEPGSRRRPLRTLGRALGVVVGSHQRVFC